MLSEREGEQVTREELELLAEDHERKVESAHGTTHYYCCYTSDPIIDAFIAGADAVLERAKVLEDALEKIAGLGLDETATREWERDGEPDDWEFYTADMAARALKSWRGEK